MELIGKLASNNSSKIVTLPSASKDVSVKFADQFIHIINNKSILNLNQRYHQNSEKVFTIKISITYI